MFRLHAKFAAQLSAIGLALVAVLASGNVRGADEQGTSSSSTQTQKPADSSSALFDKLDLNHDGQISADEVPAEQRRLFQRLLRRNDRNNDGKLSRQEFIAGMAEDQPRRADDRPRPATAATAADEQARIETYPIKVADPKLAVAVLQTMLASSPDVKLALDEKSGNIVALAKPQQLATIRAVIAKLEDNQIKEKDPAKIAALPEIKQLRPDDMQRAERDIARQMDGSDAMSGSGSMSMSGSGSSNTKPATAANAAGANPTGEAGRAGDGRQPGGVAGDGPRGGFGGPPGGPGGIGPFMGTALFRALDTNGDGKLDATEIAAANAVLKKLANSNGEITREDLLQSMPGGRAAAGGLNRGGPNGGPGREQLPAPAAISRMLQTLEKNGKLQREDLPPRLQNQFDQLDANGDGVLMPDELKNLLPRLQERLDASRGGAAEGKGPAARPPRPAAMERPTTDSTKQPGNSQ